MPNQPSSTLTFLFTDIEGSTRLWQEFPEQMKANLARHDQLLRECIERNEGHVFKTVGDAFCAAFSTAPQAMKAAIEAQQALLGENWGEAAIKVRMGLYSGDAEERDNDYFGNTLNRTARLMSAGHGGQILLSQATQALVRDKIPRGVTLLDLGECRLKDLDRPEHIHQINVEGLPSKFPGLKTLDKYRHNLPVQMTSFIGREEGIADVKQAVSEHRLVTLTGSGGAGKTRLSLQVAADLLDQFPEGIWFVELAPITDPDLIPQTILFAAGIPVQPGRSAIDSLVDSLKDKTTLLVLDNCEHLIEACAKLAETLLNAAANLKILASSREALGVRGEQAWHVPSLSIPDLKHLPPMEGLEQYEAVRLFVDRARLAQPAFSVTGENAPAVAQICARLDGIPLAIELAAARVKVLSVEQIAPRLDDRFRLLTGGARTALPRQQTLRAAIDWSYDLLSEKEKRLLRRLAVFVGGWTLELTEQVCSDEELESLEVLDVLSKLVDKSLVSLYEGHAEARYRMLETVRQYGREKLFESGEGERVRDRHLQAYIAMAETAEPEIRGAGQVRWMKRLDDEVDNLRGALEWSQGRNADSFLRLASGLWRFWHVRGYTADMEWLPNALAATTDLRTGMRARAMARAAFVAYNNNDLSQAREWATEAERLSRETEDKPGLISALDTLGNLEPNPERALALLDQALVLIRETGSHWEMSGNLNSRAGLAWTKNDLKTARSYFEQALSEARLAGDKRRICYGLENLGHLSLAEGDTFTTENYCREALAEAQAIGDDNHIFSSRWSLALVRIFHEDHAGAREILDAIFKMSQLERNLTSQAMMLEAWMEVVEGSLDGAIEQLEGGLSLASQTKDQIAITNLLYSLGDAYRRKGDFEGSREKFAEAMGIYQRESITYGFCACLEGFGMLAIDQGQAERGARLLGARERLRAGEFLVDFIPFMVQQREAYMAAARDQLGDPLFRQAWEAGSALSTEEALKYALEEAAG